jgi:protease-4
MQDFLRRHPFTKRLLQKSITLIVLWNVVLALLFGGLIWLAILAVAGSDDPADDTGDYSYVFGNGSQRLLSIKVTGTIVGTDADGGLFSADDQTAGYEVKKQLIEAANDYSINGVILEINSPGGTIYGAHAIADGVKYYREKTDQPVYSYVEGLAASGGYWAAVSTDKIYADYGSDVGSIGIIMGPFVYYDKPLAEDGGLLGGGIVTQNGIENTYITAGKSKDVGNPYRRLTGDELRIMQQSVNNEYDNFVSYVVKQRNIPEDTIRNQLGALTYDNKTAEEYKLIDGTKNREDAYQALADKVGISDDFAVVRHETSATFLQDVLGAITRQPKKEAKSVDTCTLTRGVLAYHGDVATLCSK